MSFDLNPREIRLLQDSGMDWDSAKKMVKMVKTVFADSEITAITKTDPVRPQSSNIRVFPVRYGDNGDNQYIMATKGGAPLKKKSNQPQTSLPFQSQER